ncbi:mechanosensitive ion channel family protein [Candidatus Bathyarchaeota archaeon]|nr:MAG: mechanosensitive ion channel family protein [Candidatus Bathyarchaeota archaeon]RLI21435.1 MAG: mechanosensitive ion channel family protein [Candidatus Bathyarchaeota archaeon]
MAISLIILNFIFGWRTAEEIPPILQPYTGLIAIVQPYVVYIQAVLLLVFGYMAVRSASAMVYTYVRRVADHPTAASIRTITRVVGLAVLLSMLASVFNVNPSAALTIGSFGGLVVGFATQTILSHVIAGIFLLLFRPFKYGDLITVAGKTGVVKNITLMHLVLEDQDKENVILIPSGSVVTQIIQIKRSLKA